MSESFRLDEADEDSCLTPLRRDQVRRAYAAVEAYKLGRGGVTLIANLFSMSPETIKKGQLDLA